MKTLGVFFVSLFCVIAAFGQKDKPNTNKTKSFAEIKSELKSSKLGSKTYILYDKFKDYSVAGIEGSPFSDEVDTKYGVKVYSHRISSFFYFTGLELKQSPQAFALCIEFESNTALLDTNPEAWVIADSIRYVLGSGKRTRYTMEKEEKKLSVKVEEHYCWTIKSDDFQKIGEAKKFEMKVENIELFTDPEHLEIIKTLYQVSDLSKQKLR